MRRIAALDASHKRGRPLVAVALLYDLEKGPLHVATALLPEEALFPYVPGLLSFREAPAYLEALAALPEAPEALLVDGQGWPTPGAWGSRATWGSTWTFPAWAWPSASSTAGPKPPCPRKRGRRCASSPRTAARWATSTGAARG